ncbi:MAG: tyrosine-type recombinase/integrase [Sphingomonadales bacterium]|nr:tyrosine-type recombinase/integrase [Sphingomonadales bacterium]
MATGTISKRSVDATKPGTRDQFLWDDEVPGFGLKVTPAGAKVYLFQYRIGGRGATTRRYTIGKHGPLTPDQARTRAKALAHMAEEGTDPRQAEDDALAAKADAKREAEAKAKLEGELAFEKVAARWLEEYELHHKPRTAEQARHVVNARLLPALKGKPLPHITRTDLQAIIDAIPLKHHASRLAVYAYASVLFGWAMARGEIGDNPVRLMAKPEAPKARKRVLADDELASVWKAADALRDPYGAFFKLLILTGQRREEVAALNWNELDRATATWTIPADRAKNSVASIVPLSDAALRELDRLALAKQQKDCINDQDATRWPKAGPVLTTYGATSIKSYSQAKGELDKAISEARGEQGPLAAWRVHDLRRTLATGLQRLGVRFEVTEAVLNHVSGSKAGVAGIYQRHDWKEEKRSALDAWAKHVAAILKPAEQNNVVPIGAAQRSA